MTAEVPASTGEGPLSPAELAELESTLLPGLERHHLRLLAHGLRTLQAIATADTTDDDGPRPQSGALPTLDAIRAWTAHQPSIATDTAFIEALSGQLQATGFQLAQLAAELDRPPLSLELGDLTAWATREANQRLSQPPPGASP
ncbi:hypothetical protein [Cyanobium sp. T1B-Tous]|uniref:hypothetical protein n=1 Tax=Cyanobium sp. T1B-Tous TaxID=2823721 RepID=UPI0020CCB5AE|nr:hypothetical protein [Cyanobium sp. T1B-Tous]